jgi:peptide chain release factor 1
MNEGTSGGFKEVILKLAVKDVCTELKFEAGVHRVQRVTSNRNSRTCSHISSDCYGASGSREFDVQIDDDVRVDFFLFFWTRWTICKYTKSACV